MSQRTWEYRDFSGAIQQRTTTHIKQQNEVSSADNADFSTRIGAVVKRLGVQSTTVSLPALPQDKTVLGAFIARYPTATELWAAQNVSGDSSSTLWWRDGASWTAIKTSMPAGAQVNMMNDLDEVWVALYNLNTDTIGDPFTVDASHNVSTTRQLQFGPKARFYIEFNGAIYAGDCLVDGVRYRDRLYKSSGPTGVISFSRTTQTLAQTAADPLNYSAPFQADSVRYIKPTMLVDIYEAGTNNLKYQLTVSAVDKANDTITFGAPDTTTFASTDVNTSTDVITVPSNTWMTTGKPVTYWQGTTVPAGLTQAATYYIIRLTATTIKLATTAANAAAGTAIDLTSQGSGTHCLTFTPSFNNKDEIWGRDRKGKLTRYWNTDYRNPENAVGVN